MNINIPTSRWFFGKTDHNIRTVTISYIVFCIICLASLKAQPSEDTRTGAVTGRVQSIATGDYLRNVIVSIEGTDLAGLTDGTGSFRLSQIPSGPITLGIFYPSAERREINVNIPAGGVQDTGVILLYVLGREEDETIDLKPFEVTAAFQTESELLAVNEQRYAKNIKNVVSTEALGDIPEGNIAEFLRFLPGTTVDGNSVSVRGFDSRLSPVSVDGARLASATATGQTRRFQFLQVTINDISRIEVTKVPTPANPADMLGGSINLISKSAFERASSQFTYRSYLTGLSHQWDLNKTPHSYEKNTFKVLPNFDFDYTLPINENLGIVVTGMTSSVAGHGDIAQKTYRTKASGSDASVENPYLRRFDLFYQPNGRKRKSVSFKVDWRPMENAVLSYGINGAYYNGDNGQFRTIYEVGTTGTSKTATGVPLTFDATSTSGATGRGRVDLDNNFLNITGQTLNNKLNFRFDDGTWRIESALHYSDSRAWRRAQKQGHFQSLRSRTNVPLRITFEDIDSTGPNIIRGFDNNGQEVDLNDVKNYYVRDARVQSHGTIWEDMSTAFLNVRRDIHELAFPLAVEVGGEVRIQRRDAQLRSLRWSPDGKLPAEPFASQVYNNVKTRFGYDDLPMISPHVAHEAWTGGSPSIFTKTDKDIVNEEKHRIINSEYINEQVDAAYFQMETALLDNKLQVLTGVRFEKTTDSGSGPLTDPGAVYVRDSDDTLARDSNGDLIRKPEAGVEGSLEEVGIINLERGESSKRSYDGYYPSLHLTYSVNENLLVRLAYARTYGRPDFNSVIPGTVVNEFDNEGQGLLDPTIRVRNTGLEPWTADNYDLSVEYYTDTGDVFSFGAYDKKIANFFGQIQREVTQSDVDQFGLDPRTLGWDFITDINAGNAEVRGLEANIQLELERFGAWGKDFSVFANTSHLSLIGDRLADFKEFQPMSLKWGVTFRKGPLTILTRVNQRGLKRRGARNDVGPDGFEYFNGFNRVDVNLTYQVGERTSLFLNAQDALRSQPVRSRYGSATPDYAKQFRVTDRGTTLSMGVRGRF